MTSYQANFIQNLKFYRKRAGISQAELAEKCNVSNGTIGNIECGMTKPSFDLIFLIANALKLPPTELFKSAEVTQDTIGTQFEIVKETLNSAMSDAVAKVIKDLEPKFRIEH